MNIAVVTREFAPLTKNGGIGAAVRGLCEDLASHGHNLTVYYTGRPEWRMWAFAADVSKQGMNFKPIVSLPGLLLRDPVRRCRKAYAVLSRTRHDVYIFHEFMADGLFYLRAHRQKGAFAHSRLGVVTHGSALWVDEGNDCVAQDGKRRHLYAMEQECCELADFVVSPSRYLIGWMRDKGVQLPEATHCIPNFLPSTCKAPSPPPQRWQMTLNLSFLAAWKSARACACFAKPWHSCPARCTPACG